VTDSDGRLIDLQRYLPFKWSLYFVLRYQQNSASEVLDASGAIVGETRYFPFGDVRVSAGSMFTDRLYTG